MTTDTRDALLNAARRIDERCAMDGEGPIERFERLAKLFRRETGFTAPGKDMLTLSFPDEGYERRRIEAWDAWSKAPFDDLRAALRTPRPEDAREGAVAELACAAKAMVDPPLRYVGATIEIDCGDHATAMQVVARVRAALAALTQPEATR